jgi:two-component system nitrogen regulation response regulator GlnG
MRDKSSSSPLRAEHELGLAGLVEKQLTRYINADRQVLPSSGLYDRIMTEVERPVLRLALGLVDGNKVAAARLLGLSRNTFAKKLRAHGLYAAKSENSKRAARRRINKAESAS